MDCRCALETAETPGGDTAVDIRRSLFLPERSAPRTKWSFRTACNHTFELIWMGCGGDDVFTPGARKLSDLLREEGVHHTFRENEGGHVMLTFRRELIGCCPCCSADPTGKA